MADSDQSIFNLRYNQVSGELEGFGGGSPQWTQLTLTNTDPSQVPPTRQINTTAPLVGGGDLSANRTLSISLTSAHILVGNGSNAATDTAVTGAIAITNAGVTSLNSGVVHPAAISTTNTDVFAFPANVTVGNGQTSSAVNFNAANSGYQIIGDEPNTALRFFSNGTELIDFQNSDVIMAASTNLKWLNGIFGSSADTGLRRTSAGQVEINNGTPATYRDLALRTEFSNATQSTLTGSAGTAVCSQPQQGPSYKKVVVYLSGYTDTGTQVYTYPTAFSHSPYVYGFAAGVSGATATTTTITFTVTTQTGFVFVEGY